MKARMLCVLLMLVGMESAAKEKIQFNTLIEGAEAETRSAHQKALKTQEPSEAMAFYNTEWLRLRQRKTWSVAQAEIKLKPSREKSPLKNRPESTPGVFRKTSSL